jgi:chloramphenicol O-acetyltransferase type A
VKKIDIESWKRREHFEFFRNHAFPYLSTTVKVPCDGLVDSCRQSGDSLFARYLYAASVAANQTPALRLRYIDGAVYEQATLHVGTTIGRSDGTFAFSFTEHNSSFAVFMKRFEEEKRAVHESSGLRLHTDGDRTDLVHYTSIPWFSFEHLSHPVRTMNDSVPKIAFGKIETIGNSRVLPVNIQVHHALVDGIDLGEFFENLKQRIQ